MRHSTDESRVIGVLAELERLVTEYRSELHILALDDLRRPFRLIPSQENKHVPPPVRRYAHQCGKARNHKLLESGP